MDEKSVPKHILDIMHSSKTIDFNSRIEEKFKLAAEQIHKLAILEGKIFYKELTLADFPMAIKSQLNIDAEKAKSIAFDVCQSLFLPAKDYLLGVRELMIRLKPSQAQSPDSNIVDLKNQSRE